MKLMLSQGFSATTVDQVCEEAGLTKGSFFHYFDSKEQMGRAAVDFFSCCQQQDFAAVGLDRIADPVDRIHRLFDAMIEMLQRPGSPGTCLVGMIAQEMATTNELMRDCCDGHFTTWTLMVTGILSEAKQERPPKINFEPEAIAWMITSLLQGSMLIAKTKKDRTVIIDSALVSRGRAALLKALRWRAGASRPGS